MKKSIVNPTVFLLQLYLGLSRIDHFSSNERPVEGLRNYSVASVLPNTFAYRGAWSLSDEYANPQEGAELLLNFTAKNVFLVMRTKDGKPAGVNVILDDGSPRTITVTQDKLYSLVELDSPDQHDLRLEFDNSNIEIFAFTFG